MMTFDEAVTARRSVRGYRPDPVPEPLLRECLELAQLTPSNCNVQPWRIYIASGEARDRASKRMVEAYYSGQFEKPDHPQEVFSDEYRTLQVACAVELYGQMGVERGDKVGRAAAMARNFEIFDAPHLVVICMDRRFGIATALTMGMWMQTLVLALTARGIQSCPMASLQSFPTILRDELDIPDQHMVLCGMAVGYEDDEVPANRTRQPRAPLEDNVFWR